MGHGHHGGGGRGNWGGWGGGGPTIWSPTLVEPVFLAYPLPATLPTTDEVDMLPAPYMNQYPQYVGEGLDGFGSLGAAPGKNVLILGFVGGIVGSIIATKGSYAAAIGATIGVGVGALLSQLVKE